MLNGTVCINGRDKIEVEFTPNTLTGRQNITGNFGGQAALFNEGLSYYDSEQNKYITGNSETIVHEDWVCEYVN